MKAIHYHPRIFTISSYSPTLLKPSNTQTRSSLYTLCFYVFKGASLKTLGHINQQLLFHIEHQRAPKFRSDSNKLERKESIVINRMYEEQRRQYKKKT